MGYLTMAKWALALLPSIIDAVKTAEQLVTESGQGPSKLMYVRSLLEAIAEATEMKDFAAVWPVLARMVELTVVMFNRFGWPD